MMPQTAGDAAALDRLVPLWLPALPPFARTERLVVWARWLGHFGMTMLVAAPAARGACLWSWLAAPAFGITTNLAYAALRPVRRAPIVGALLLMDIALAAAILGATGGALNPYTLILLWWVVIGAMVQPIAGTVVLTLGAVAAYGVIYATTDPNAHHTADMGGHMFGMWMAFAIVAPVVAGAVTVARRAVAEAHREHAEAQRAEERATRAASLTTLAAGAAHELATPLGGIAVEIGELERRIGAHPELTGMREDVERCRRILRQLSADLGAGMGEARARVPIATVVDLALEQVFDADRIDIADEATLDIDIDVMPRLVATALGNVLRNAIVASPGAGRVTLTVTPGPHEVTLLVADQGAGMDATTAARAGEPFFTTRAKGTGLGLFVARSAIEQSGGRFRLDSAPGRGTRVEMTVRRAL